MPTSRFRALHRSARDAALLLLDELWSELTVVPADGPRLRAASAAALRDGLRGYDAVHCAAALAVADDDLVAASGDQELLSAWRDDGLAVVDMKA
ncbi:PIN domain-containing protein [Modestobacter sp. VKM Ac-2983]|uniref:PIN domain-containing protein n=1 Tax=Modestobacter sp. VKM Ac-2983 TaxID=3004137 RepID=UPI0022AB9A52|nr:PIN domain-containing protein [Modestobacter sp. VKM Ac-2983]MCZ2804869.1 PIN domain-containing protein [Modestobacter sp. VKM Ac-2983]